MDTYKKSIRNKYKSVQEMIQNEVLSVTKGCIVL